MVSPIRPDPSGLTTCAAASLTQSVRATPFAHGLRTALLVGQAPTAPAADGPGVRHVIFIRLVLSPKTVRDRVSNIFSKLQVADRVQAALRAREAEVG